MCNAKWQKTKLIAGLFLQILSQMNPQTITEIDALLGNKPHSKKELRAWRCKSEWQMMFRGRRRRQWHWETSLFALLYTQQLACPRQHYASSMCAYPILRSIMYEKKRWSQLLKKKETTGHILLTADCSQTNYSYRGVERQVSAIHWEVERYSQSRLDSC